MKKYTTFFLFLLFTVTVKAQVFVALANNTGNTIENLTVNGVTYGKMEPGASKTVQLKEVRVVRGKPVLNVVARIEGMVQMAASQRYDDIYITNATSGNYKLNIVYRLNGDNCFSGFSQLTIE